MLVYVQDAHDCAQVSKQPAHTFSARGHFLRVLPVFAWLPLAWLLHGAAMWLTGWKARRDAGRLESLQMRRETMLSDLKVRAGRCRVSVPGFRVPRL